MKVKPFSTSPNPNVVYLTSALRVTLEKVRFVVEERQGLTAILGDVGVGKTTITRYLFNEFDARKDVRASMIASPNFPSEFAFLKKICADFELPPRRSMGDQETTLRNFLLELYAEDTLCVVFVDEAQRLPGRQLELVRTLLNFETDEAKLIQVVLSGQLELRTKLMDPSKKAIRSRIFAPSHLASFSLTETAEMIAFRCKEAGISDPFEPEAVQALYTFSGGVPRETLKIAAVAYRFSGGEKITAQDVADAQEEARLNSDANGDD